jgi:hypothetical protein
MSLFLPNIPQANDNLDFSQGQLLSNNQGLDTVFGVDHYKFSDATVNKGFHNQVTTPPYVASPPTGLPPATTTAPIFYSFQNSAPLGVLQYSRGTSNAVPTPVTSLQSPAAAQNILALSTVNILDFTGLARAYGDAYAVSLTNPGAPLRSIVNFVWDGTSLSVVSYFAVTTFRFTISASNLALQNATASTINDIYWSIDFTRIQ